MEKINQQIKSGDMFHDIDAERIFTVIQVLEQGLFYQDDKCDHLVLFSNYEELKKRNIKFL